MTSHASLKIVANLHTHTCRCKHAQGAVADYCTAAAAAGLSVLGISDHAALPDNRWLGVRMHSSDLPEYCREIDAAQQAFPDLTVLKAMECDIDPAYEPYYRDELLGRLGFDYLIGAVHWFPYQGQWVSAHSGTRDAATLRAYTDWVIEGMRCGLFAFVAHPDVFGCSYPRWDRDAESCSRDLLRAAAALRMPLEINGYGLRKPQVETPDGRRPMYPWRRFWELAREYDVEVVIASDAHEPWNVVGNIDEATALGESCSLRVADLSRLWTTAERTHDYHETTPRVGQPCLGSARLRRASPVPHDTPAGDNQACSTESRAPAGAQRVST
jgi:histidinol-phosphatase (PHP family)